MNTEILLEPRFTGERFRANTLPLSLLLLSTLIQFR